jgi:hypothetical protein
MISQLAALGYTVDYVSDGSPKALLTYSSAGKNGDDGQPETPTTRWQLRGSMAQVDILSPNALLDGSFGKINLANISASDKKAIRKFISSPPEDPDELPPVDSGDSGYAYLLMLAGVTSYNLAAPTLSASKIVSGSYSVKASLSNVGRIYSTNTLQLVENIPSDILFNLPDSSIKTADYGLLYHAWCKNYPEVEQVGGNRWQINQTWDFGLWPQKLYGTVL